MNRPCGIRRRATAVAAVVVLSSITLCAQAPLLFTERWDAPPPVASSSTAGAWYPDRYPPAIFESSLLNGENVLHVGIRSEDAYANRPSGNRSSFHNTQGRKFNLSRGNTFGSALIADVYVGMDWDSTHRMATLWSTGRDTSGDVSFYTIFGFRNTTGSDPGFYAYGIQNVGAYTLVPFSITYGRWYSLRIELTDTAFVYSINGMVVLSDTTLNGTTYFSDLMLQAYNFADSTLSASNQSFEEYDVYWDNVGAVVRPVRFLNPAVVDLRTAGSFRILAGSAVTIGSGATVGGDVGVSPGTTVTNAGTIAGAFHVNDGAAVQAQADLIAAYADASARSADTVLQTELGGMTLGRGVYTSPAGTFGITGTLTLSGTAADVFIFQMSTTLTTGANSHVLLTDGALAENVVWMVGSSATIDGDFKGTIVALTAITQQVGSTILGRALARNSFVTVNGASVSPVEDATFAGPADYRLLQNFPNPFNPSTIISFELPASAMVSLSIYDVLGREVSVVLSEELPAGRFSRQWNADGVPAGVYLYRLTAGEFTETRKLLLLR